MVGHQAAVPLTRDDDVRGHDTTRAPGARGGPSARTENGSHPARGDHWPQDRPRGRLSCTAPERRRHRYRLPGGEGAGAQAAHRPAGRGAGTTAWTWTRVQQAVQSPGSPPACTPEGRPRVEVRARSSDTRSHTPKQRCCGKGARGRRRPTSHGHRGLRTVLFTGGGSFAQTGCPGRRGADGRQRSPGSAEGPGRGAFGVAA